MKNGMKRMLMVYLAGLVACLVVPGMLKAANLNITDTGSGSYTLTPDANWDVTSFSGGGTYTEGTTTNFSGAWLTGGTLGTGTYTVYFTDGNTNQYDDVLTYTVTNLGGYDTISGSFQSSATSLGPVPLNATTWNEYNGTFTFSASNLTGQVVSENTPEPNTAALLGAGFLGLLGISLVPRLRKGSTTA